MREHVIAKEFLRLIVLARTSKSKPWKMLLVVEYPRMTGCSCHVSVVYYQFDRISSIDQADLFDTAQRCNTLYANTATDV